MKIYSHVLFLGCFGAALNVSAHAQLVAHDSFSYPEGALAGNNGGTGFTSAYVSSGATVAVVPGLTYPGLTGAFAPTGNAMAIANNQNLAATSINGRNWLDTTPVQPAAGTTYWYSVLVNPSASGGTLVPFVRPDSNSNGQNGWGIRVDGAAGGTTVNIKAWSPTQAASPIVSLANGYGNTYMVVGRLVVGATNTTNTIWVNPTLGVEPTTGGVSITQASSTAFVTRLSGRSFSSPAGSMVWDELRIGMTAGDVMPVPEPASMFVLGLGLLALGRKKRK